MVCREGIRRRRLSHEAVLVDVGITLVDAELRCGIGSRLELIPVKRSILYLRRRSTDLNILAVIGSVHDDRAAKGDIVARIVREVLGLHMAAVERPRSVIRRIDLQHCLVCRAAHVKDHTVGDSDLLPDEAELIRRNMSAIDHDLPGESARTAARLQHARGIRRLVNAECRERQIGDVQHGSRADVDAVRVDEYHTALACARLVHRPENVGELCVRHLIDEGLAVRNGEIQRLASSNVERVPVDLTVVIRRDGRIVRDRREIRSAVDGDIPCPAYDLAARRHSECGARQSERDQSRKAPAPYVLFDLHSVISFPILRSSRLP